MSRNDDLTRIESGLRRAAEILERFTPGEVEHRKKSGGDPVTEADTEINDALLELLPRKGEGWLSEETADDAGRLRRERVWIVDPLDGTKEFVQGIPEWCVSIGLVEDGRAVAGGICAPSRDLVLVGSLETGVRANGSPCTTRRLERLDGVGVLASRSEVGRGEWDRFHDAAFEVVPMGSVALKMALVAAGLADATWTLVPKHEWDVAAGAALVRAAGGAVWLPGGAEPRFNQPVPLYRGLLATPAGLEQPVKTCLASAISEMSGT